MRLKHGFGPALMALALALVMLPSQFAAAETCTVESFGDAVDASAAELRAFSTETQPKLRQKLASLRDRQQWTDPDFESKGLALVHDKKLDDFDAKASDLLSRIDTLGSPETETDGNAANCANLAELKAASSELISVMRAKSNYLIAKLDKEIAASPAVPQQVAKVETPSQTEPTAPAAAPVTEPQKPAAAEPAPAQPSLSPIRKTETPPPKPTPTPQVSAAPHATEPPHPKTDTPAEATTKSGEDVEGTSSWSTTTAQAVIPPPQVNRPPPSYDTPPPGRPYELPSGEPLPPGEMPPDAQAFDPEGGGYSIDEIREATRGFFGTISTSLASVIEHAFKKAGRPTAYVLGTEGGGAFLAGLRYGEGTLYLRNGGSQKVFWHGPSIGYDLGAEGSRTLFLIYDLHEPDGLFRRFTGVDGSAYLVGGVGMTLLKGGDVVMAPIRSGLGLRLGANIGYVRFSPRPTWNPF